MNEGRAGLLSAGGILAIIIGVFELIGGGMLVALASLGIPFGMLRCPFLPGYGGAGSISVIPIWLIIIGALLVVLGIIAIAGGVSAVKRKSFGLSLAGAICALPSGILGILAVIFVSLGKGEFEAEY
jgi:hypothetical protein